MTLNLLEMFRFYTKWRMYSFYSDMFFLLLFLSEIKYCSEKYSSQMCNTSLILSINQTSLMPIVYLQVVGTSSKLTY